MRRSTSALESPELGRSLAAQTAEIVGGTPDAFASLIKTDYAKWAKVRESLWAPVKLIMLADPRRYVADASNPLAARARSRTTRILSS